VSFGPFPCRKSWSDPDLERPLEGEDHAAHLENSGSLLFGHRVDYRQRGPGNGNFALSGFRKDGDVRGKLTLIGSQGQVFHADLVCIGAAVDPDGIKRARLVGRFTGPAFSFQSLLFNVSDTGLPGADGDTFAGSLSPAAPEDIPCEPTPGIDPIAHGNISIVVD